MLAEKWHRQVSQERDEFRRVVMDRDAVERQTARLLFTGLLKSALRRPTPDRPYQVKRALLAGFSIGEIAEHKGVRIFGLLNLPGRVPVNASSLYARNLQAFIDPFIDKDKKTLAIDWEDEVFARTVTERLLMYAVNRRLEYFDMPQVRGIVRSAAKDNYSLSSLVLGIVNSNAFRRQGPDGAH